MTKIFVDTDVCIDLLSGREPFNKSAEILFSLADMGKIKVYLTSLSFPNIDYILRSHYSSTHSRQIIGKFKTTIITRNIRDYKKATIQVLTPETFLSTFK